MWHPVFPYEERSVCGRKVYLTEQQRAKRWTVWMNCPEVKPGRRFGKTGAEQPDLTIRDRVEPMQFDFASSLINSISSPGPPGTYEKVVLRLFQNHDSTSGSQSHDVNRSVLTMKQSIGQKCCPGAANMSGKSVRLVTRPVYCEVCLLILSR